MPFYGLAEAKIGGRSCVISQSGFSGEAGYEIYLRNATLYADDMWNAVLKAGEKHNLMVIAPAHHRRIAAGILIILFSLQMLGIFNLRFLNQEKRIETQSYKNNYAFPLLVGAAFAFGWTPCIGPVLGSILALSATEASVSTGVLLLSFYSLGLAIPFILSGYYMSRFLNTRKGFSKYYGRVTKTGGVILLLTGILIATNQIQVISYYILTIFPFLTTLG